MPPSPSFRHSLFFHCLLLQAPVTAATVTIAAPAATPMMTLCAYGQICAVRALLCTRHEQLFDETAVEDEETSRTAGRGGV